MITDFIVTNHLGQSVTIELARPEESGFAVLYVEGLGPVKANISLTDRAGLDGAIYNSARAEYRNIVFGIQFVGTDIGTIRHDSYKYFPIKKEIKIQINSTNRRVDVYGYIESNEPAIFSNKSGCVISILCPESYLKDLDQAFFSFSSVNSLFEFPFSNESLVSPLIEFSELETETQRALYYEGEADSGILIHIHANGVASGIVITNSITLETIAIDDTALAAVVGSGITTGDDIYISTIPGNKYAILTRSGTDYNILNTLDPVTWFQLERGDNIYAYSALSGVTNLVFTFTSDILYEGI